VLRIPAERKRGGIATKQAVSIKHGSYLCHVVRFGKTVFLSVEEKAQLTRLAGLFMQIHCQTKFRELQNLISGNGYRLQNGRVSH